MRHQPCAQKRDAMAPLQGLSALFLLLSIFCLHFGKCVQVILGDEFTFPNTACETTGGQLVKLIGQGSTREVAALSGGVWISDNYYRDRVSENSTTVRFNHTVFTDTGTYELTCSSGEDHVIQLEVVVPHEPSVEEGGAVKLKCYCDVTDKRVESAMWTKHEELVLKLNLSSGVKRYGTGYEGKVSLPDAYKEGDMSLLLTRAQMTDGGDYFCSVHTGQVRNNVSAVRLTVKEGTEKETTNATMQPPTQSPCEETSLGTWVIVAITAVVTFVFSASVFGLIFFCWLKCRRSSVSSAPDSAPRSEEDTELLDTQTPPPQVNGCPPSTSPDAESSV